MNEALLSALKIALRIFLAALFGGIIGLERESKHRPAGFRTHMLVCVGAMSVMLLSELIFERYHSQYGISTDPMRLAAQVVSGVGFLGAGTIIHYGATITGLTTAASLWAVSAIGLIIGAGFYYFAGAVFAAIWGILFLYGKLPRKMRNEGAVAEIIVEIADRPKIIGEISLCLEKNRAEVLDMTYVSAPHGDSSEIIKLKVIIRFYNNPNSDALLKALKSIDGVIGVEKI